MKRAARLQSAKSWLPKYNGKNVIRGYSKWFGLDYWCAIKELRMLGVKIDEDYVEQLKASLEANSRAKQQKKKLKEEYEIEEQYPYPDDTFAFIPDEI